MQSALAARRRPACRVRARARGAARPASNGRDAAAGEEGEGGRLREAEHEGPCGLLGTRRVDRRAVNVAVESHILPERAIRSLLSLQAPTARRLTECGHERDIPLADVQAGQRLRVRPGETVPVDGALLAQAYDVPDE